MGIFNSNEVSPPSNFIVSNIKGFTVDFSKGGGDEGGISLDSDYDKLLGRILFSNAIEENRSSSIEFLTNIKTINL